MTEDFESDTRFADSVDNYTVNNLKHREKSRSGSQVTALLIRSLIIAFCIGLMGYSGFQIISKTVEDKKAEEVVKESSAAGSTETDEKKVIGKQNQGRNCFVCGVNN